MELLALLFGIGIISSIFSKKTDSPQANRKTLGKLVEHNEWDGEINGTGLSNDSNWSKVRDYILKRDNYTCQSCGLKNNLTVDHIIQLSRGGTNNSENLQTLCRYCHEKKDNRKIFDRDFDHNDNYGSKTLNNPKIQILENAIRSSSKVKIKYTDINQNITYREILPKHFTKEHGINYLIAFCNLRDEKRTFRISRIEIL